MHSSRLQVLASLLLVGSATAVYAQTKVREASAVQPSAGNVARSSESTEEQTIVIGDELSFRIMEDEDPAQVLTVTDSGVIHVPYVGNIVAVGKTPRALAAEIKRSLESNLYKKATVLLALERRSIRSPGHIYLTGEVNKQGPLDIPASESLTVSRAILQAGGFSDFANKRKVKLIHKSSKGQTSEVVDVVEVLQKGRADLDRPVAPGDVIIVPARLINW